MKEVFTEIEIAAPPAVVWKLLTGLEGYHRWNPFIRRSEGKAIVGHRLTCCPTMPDGRRYVFHPTVTSVEPERLFAWTGYVLSPWLAEGEHIFEIHKIDERTVRHIHRQAFRGILSRFMSRRRLETIRRGFELMNAALKKVAEEERME
jgi:hypothetical protein